MHQRLEMRGEQGLRQRLAARAWLLIVKRDVDLLELSYGVLMLGWGLQLLMPWDTFRSSIGYQVLAQIMPEGAWGLLLACVGAIKIGAYLLDLWSWRLGATLGAVMIWTFLAVAFGLANPYGTAVVVYPVLAFTSALVFWRLLTHRVEQA